MSDLARRLMMGAAGATGEKTYVEDVFSTYLHTGTGATATQPIVNGVALTGTAEWSGYRLDIIPNAIKLDSSGNIHIVGSGGSYLRKLNSQFSSQWFRLDTAISGNAQAVDLDSSGNIFVASIGTQSGIQRALLYKYNSSGTVQWCRAIGYYGSSLGAGANGVAVDTNGDIYVTGYANDGNSNYCFITKYNTSGTVVWQRLLRQSGYNGSGNGISTDASNNVYIAGFSSDASRGNMIVAKYNSSGTIQWTRKFYDAGDNTGIMIRANSSGDVYVAGYCADGSSQYYNVLVKYNSSGTVQWQRRIKLGNNTYSNGLRLDSSGNPIVICRSDNGISIVAKYDSSGTIQWQRNLMNTSTTIIYGIDIDSSNNIYLCGSTNDGNAYGFIVKMKSDGSVISGTAHVTMTIGSATAATSSATDIATTLDASDSTTSASLTPSISTSTYTITAATQAAVISDGGMVWIKSRSAAYVHSIFDTVRGFPNYIASNSTGAENYAGSIFSLVPFASGFSITGDTNGSINENGQTFASWTFQRKKNFFDVVKWTGNGVNNRKIAHSLGQTPGMIMIKSLSDTNSWFVWHRSLTSGRALELCATGASFLYSSIFADPTATELTVNDGIIGGVGGSVPSENLISVNANGKSYVAYIFAHDTSANGLIQCGTFTTDGAGAATVNLGYEAQFVIVKAASATEAWYMQDIMRGMNLTSFNILYPNANSSELVNSSLPYYYPTATGFGVANNTGSRTFIYMAIRRGPMRKPTDATKFYRGALITPAASSSVGFPPDLAIVKPKTSGQNNNWFDRSRGPLTFLSSDSSGSETVGQANSLTNLGQNGITLGSWYTGVGSTSVEHLRRAPGFFDIVCYTGDGNASIGQNVTHNLTVDPELIIVRQRDLGGGNWHVWIPSFGIGAGSKQLILNNTDAQINNTGAISYFSGPTSTTFNVGYGSGNYSGALYAAYLFASCPGVSKVGTYTGNGTTLNIDCGFTNGARFIMIKRIDSTGDWYYWDSTRGIVAANDPYLRFNSTGAEVTTDDGVDPLAAGFTVNQTSTSNINVNTATYIYLAIA